MIKFRKSIREAIRKKKEKESTKKLFVLKVSSRENWPANERFASFNDFPTMRLVPV